MVPNYSDNEIQLGHILHILWQKKWIILLITFLSGCLALGYAMYKKPLYKASIVLMPPFDSEVVPFNQTRLNLFNSNKLFAVFISALTSENNKYKFFKDNIFPLEKKNNDAVYNSHLYNHFAKTFKIDAVPGTINYRVSYTHSNPSIPPKEIINYINFVNKYAFYQVAKIAKREHERAANLLQQKINFETAIAKSKAKSQLIVLQEAIQIAESAGIENPLNDKHLIRSFDADPNHMFHNGTKSLKALAANLSNRTNFQAFIPALNSMIILRDFYKDYQLIYDDNQLYSLDGSDLPPVLISFSSATITITSLLLGFLTSIIAVLLNYHFSQSALLFYALKQEYTESNLQNLKPIC